MQRPQQTLHSLEGVADEGGGLGFGVRAGRDLDVELEGGQTVVGRMPAGDEPACGIGALHEQGGDRQVLLEMLGREVGDERGDFGPRVETHS